MSVFSKFYQRKSGIDTFFQRGVIVKKDGLTVAKIAVATFDTADTDSSGVSNKTIAAHGLGVYLPDNAVITRTWFDVITTFTSAGANAGTIALKVQSANDLSSALAISDERAMFAAGMHQCIPNSWMDGGGTVTALIQAAARATSWIKLTAERELIATVATQLLTAGKLVLYVEYVISE